MSFESHAIRELSLLGEDDETVEWMIRVVKEFTTFGHSGGSASVLIPMLNDLLQFKNLSPLTDNPADWILVAEDVWQCSRNPEAFSDDEGKTYYLLSEGGCSTYPYPKHKTESHIKE